VTDGALRTPIQQISVQFVKAKPSRAITSNAADNAIVGAAAAIAGTLVCFGLLGTGYAAYRRQQAKKSREGDDKIIPSTVYDTLKIQGASNFQSGKGMRFVSQIETLVTNYQRVHEDIGANVETFAIALANAIETTLLPNNANQTRWGLAVDLGNDEESSILIKQQQEILSQTKRNLTQNTTQPLKRRSASFKRQSNIEMNTFNFPTDNTTQTRKPTSTRSRHGSHRTSVSLTHRSSRTPSFLPQPSTISPSKDANNEPPQPPIFTT